MKKQAKVGFLAKESSRGSVQAGVGAKEGKVEVDFEPGKYYLLRNFGFENRTIFSSQEDYDRFEAYLYLLNAVDGPRASNFFLEGRKSDVFSAARGEPLVALGAYSYTAKHFNILATPIATNGIARFMQKLQTAYTMYFNLKYTRSGRLFHARYIADTAQTEAQLKFIFSYVHLSPAILFHDAWEEKEGIELEILARNALQYRYSSAGEYTTGATRIITPTHYPSYFKRTKDAQALSKIWLKNLAHKFQTFNT